MDEDETIPNTRVQTDDLYFVLFYEFQTDEYVNTPNRRVQMDEFQTGEFYILLVKITF